MPEHQEAVESTETASTGTGENEETHSEAEIQARTDIPREVKNALHKANKEATELRLKLKAQDDMEAKLREYEDRDKSDSQKLQEERDALKTERDQLRSENLRRDVADEKGLTPAQARRLVGTTREELEADADAVLEDFPVTTPKPVFEDVGQGVRRDGNAPRYRQSQLTDHTFWLANKADIQLAMAEGRIDPD